MEKERRELVSFFLSLATVQYIEAVRRYFEARHVFLTLIFKFWPGICTICNLRAHDVVLFKVIIKMWLPVIYVNNANKFSGEKNRE